MSQIPPAGEQRLTNAEARPFAEALYRELARQYHPSAVLKIVNLLELIHKRQTKTQKVVYQTQQAGSPEDQPPKPK